MRMDLNFLGCGSAFNPLYGNTSAYFTNKDQLYVIDGGESVFLKLYQKELLKKYAGITIMVTHMHADHVGSLPSIISYCYYVLGKKVTVIYPEKSLWILLGLMGIDPDIYIPVESSLFTAEGLKVWAVSVKHADDISCFGYIIEFAGEKIYYSGDSYEIPKDVLDGFYKKGNINDLSGYNRIYIGSQVTLPIRGAGGMYTGGFKKECFLHAFYYRFYGKIKEKRIRLYSK